MKKTSKLLCILLTAVMLLSSLPIVSSASDKTGTANASCGAWADVNYTYDSSSGILTLDFVLNNPNCLGESYFCLYVDESIYTDGKIVSGSRKSDDGLWTSSVQYAAGQPDFIFEMYDGPYYCFRVRRSDSYDYFADPYSGQVELGTLSFRFLPKDNYNYQDIPYRFLTYCSFSYLGDEPGVDDYSYFTIDLNNENTVENDSWTFENGVLTITGNNINYPLNDENPELWATEKAPWANEKIEKVVIEKGAGITQYAFCGRSDIKEVVFKNDAPYIYMHTFENCVNLTKVSGLDSVTYIEDYAFANTGLTSVDLPHVRMIGFYAFENCSKLESISCPFVEELGEYSLSGTAVKNIYIGESAIYIENGSLNSTQLEGISVHPENPVHKAVDNVLYYNDWLKFCPAKKQGTVIIRDGTTGISGNAFAMCTDIDEIIIPDSVEQLMENALVTKSPDCVVICSEGSDAHKYVVENNIPFILSDSSSNVSGDANGDGRLTTNDAKATLRHVAGISVLVGDNLSNADFNGDGRVTTNDAKKMLRVIAGLE